ncbi:MAG: acyl-CoA dehydrogenase family protein [Kofleriaceae bacterium]
MDFNLTPEQEALVQTAREFTRREVVPRAKHHDETGEFPHDILKRAWSTGLMNIEIPEAYGGLGGGCLDNCLVQEEVSFGCAGINTSMAANCLGATPLLVAGTEDQKKKYLTRLTSEYSFTAYGCSEPDAGSDVAGMRTRVTRHGDDYVLFGQ